VGQDQRGSGENVPKGGMFLKGGFCPD